MLLDIARPRLPSLASLRPDLSPSLASIVDRGIEPAAERRHVAAADVLAVLRESTDLVAARMELAAVMRMLRHPTLEEQRFETTPEQPEVAGPTGHPPRRDRAISETFWLSDDSESSLPLDVTLADTAKAERLALDDPAAAPVSDAVPQTNPPVVLKTRDPRPTASSHRARAVAALTAAAAALAVAFVTVTFHAGRKHDVRVVATALEASTTADEPVATRSALDASGIPSEAPATPAAPSTSFASQPAAPVLDGTAATGSKAEALCSSPGWVVVPPSRAGHRVWVDGRLVGESPGRFAVSSGRHLVRVGSRGVQRSFVVGCDEEQVAR